MFFLELGNAGRADFKGGFNNNPVVPYFPATKGGGPPPRFAIFGQVKSQMLEWFHFFDAR